MSTTVLNAHHKQDIFEKRIAALEGGHSAVATSSGMSAQFVTLLSLAHAGDNIVSSSVSSPDVAFLQLTFFVIRASLYGGVR